MRLETKNYLLSLSINEWLVGFTQLGIIIDAVADCLHENRMPGTMFAYYTLAADQTAGSIDSVEHRVRYAIGVAWRERRSTLEAVMGYELDRPPTAREFIFTSARLISSKAGG